MGVNGQMDPLNFRTNEELLFFLHRRKTEISLIDQPQVLLSQLRDHDLVKEGLYEKVKSMRSRERKQKGVYDILDWLEKERSQKMHEFWRCVFADHIVQCYPTLRLLRNSLLDGSFEVDEKPPDGETQTDKTEGEGDKGKEKKNSRKRSKDDRDNEDPGPSTASSPKKSAKKPSFSSPVKKGQKEEIWNWPIYKTQLPVTCGDKSGTLHRDKLTKGEKCIFAQRCWFTPSGFEKFAGKERCRNWKSSIRCRNTPLRKLIEENHLQCPPVETVKRRCARKSKRHVFSVSSSESSSTDFETSSSSEEDSDAEDFQEQRERGRGTQIRTRAEEDEEEEEDMSDLTDFQAPTLPVTCVSASGTLYKCRFGSGLRGKCIRTEKSWLTPEEFIKQELTDGHWKRDILCHGKTLNFLIKKKILHIHSCLCDCKNCSEEPKDLMDQNNDDECFVCNCKGELVCCDECPRSFHPECHLPALGEVPSEEWNCTFCVLKANQQWRESSNMTEQEALNAPVSQHKLHCHYLLLCAYNEDVQRVFVKDPRKTVSRYSEFISQPMWLDRIKLKLEEGEYETVGAFVSDFQLIFSNCSTFNRDNDFGQLGERLKKMFEEEFKKSFSVQ